MSVERKFTGTLDEADIKDLHIYPIPQPPGMPTQYGVAGTVAGLPVWTALPQSKLNAVLKSIGKLLLKAAMSELPGVTLHSSTNSWDD